jgi:hypothetical protein
MEITGDVDESVTVIDPRHPLYGQSFRLVGITTKQYLGRCCVVLDHASRERNLPLAVTDRSPDPLVMAPLPVDVATIEHLIHVFAQLCPQAGRGEPGAADARDAPPASRIRRPTRATGDEEARSSFLSPTHFTPAGLDGALHAAATGGAGGAGEDMSSRRHPDEPTPGREGGRP